MSKFAPAWFSKNTVLYIHKRLATQYEFSDRVDNHERLELAVRWPSVDYPHKHNGVYKCAAAYAFGIVGHRPFAEGNALTALALMILFLETHGQTFLASSDESARQIMRLSSGEISSSQLADWLSSQSLPF